MNNKILLYLQKVGASALYLLSAALILTGATMVITPIYHSSESIAEKFSLLGTLNFYEVMLLVVIWILCKWKPGNKDAVSLSCLFCIFLVASSIALNTVSLDFPITTLILGFCGLLVASYKLSLLFRIIQAPKINFYILSLVIAPNFIMPGIFGIVMMKSPVNHVMRYSMITWSISWWISLLSGIIVFLLLRMQPRNHNNTALFSNFLHQVLILVIFGITMLHLYLHNYAYNLQILWGDFIPALGVCGVLIAELRYYHKQKWDQRDILLLLLPLLFSIVNIDSNSFSFSYQHFACISYPPVFLAVFSGILLLFGRSRNPLVPYIASVYLSLAFISLNSAPKAPFVWEISYLCIALGIIFLAIGIFEKLPYWVVASVFPTIFGICVTQSFSDLTTPDNFRIVFFCLISGGMLLIISNIYKDIHELVAMLAGILFLGALFLEQNPWGIPIFASHLLISGILIVCACHQKNWGVLLPACFPLSVVLKDIMPENKGWLVIFLSFFVLAVGVLVSFYKIHHEKNSSASKDKDSSPEDSSIASHAPELAIESSESQNSPNTNNPGELGLQM